MNSVPSISKKSRKLADHPIVLNNEQVHQFQEEGYLILYDFFNDREVAAMLAELKRFQREGLGRNVATESDGKTHSRTKTNYQIIPLNVKSDLYRALPWCPKVRETVSQLIGDPYIRHLDQIFLKPPKENHSDSVRARCAYHFLRTDYIPSHYNWKEMPPVITGPDATGGEREYGTKIEGTWNAQVDRFLD